MWEEARAIASRILAAIGIEIARYERLVGFREVGQESANDRLIS
jgi:hypothetical protein